MIDEPYTLCGFVCVLVKSAADNAFYGLRANSSGGPFHVSIFIPRLWPLLNIRAGIFNITALKHKLGIIFITSLSLSRSLTFEVRW